VDNADKKDWSTNIAPLSDPKLASCIAASTEHFQYSLWLLPSGPDQFRYTEIPED